MKTDYDLDPTTPTTVAVQAEYAIRSQEAACLPSGKLDLAYGPHERHRLDVFPVGLRAPTLIFFRGGYWKAGSKDERRFPALPWRDRGVAWVAVNYRLAPDSCLSEITADARSAVAWLFEHAEELGLNPHKFHLSGNSAGAHLAAMVAAEKECEQTAYPRLASLSLVSGLFDLLPLLETAANDWLNLTRETALDLSPIHSLPTPNLPVLIGFGESETDAFKFQSRTYATACRANGNPVTLFESPGKDHFKIIGEYGDPGTPLFERLVELVAR